MALDLDSYSDGNGGFLPAIEEYYYGDYKEYHYYKPGVMGSTLNGYNDWFGSTSKNPYLAISDIPSNSIGVISNTCFAHMPFTQGYMYDASV